MDTNPTQIIGVTANALAAALCSTATLRCSGLARRYWLTLTTVFTALSLEVALGFRFEARELFAILLRQTGRYTDRQALQIFVLLTASAATIALAFAWRSRIAAAVSATGGAALASALSLALFLVESVSLHGIDTMLWHPIGGIKVVGWLWAALALAATLAALRAILASRAPTKHPARAGLEF